MKHLTLNLLFFILTICNTTNIALAQDCELPGPSDLQVVSTTVSSVELAWTEVPGAMEYLVETTEVATGIPVSIINTNNNTVIVTGLQPDTEYTTEVITVCENSGHGGSAYVDFITNVIVVDIVVGLQCAPGQIPTSSYYVSLAGPLVYNMGSNDLLFMQGYLTGQPAKHFILGFHRSSNALHVGTTPDYPNITINPDNGNPAGTVELGENTSPTSILLNKFDPTFYTGFNARRLVCLKTMVFKSKRSSRSIGQLRCRLACGLG